MARHRRGDETYRSMGDIGAIRCRQTFFAVAFVALACSAPAAPQQGLTLSFAAADKKDAREARLVALYVPEGQAATPLLPVGPFNATWSGTIASPLRAQYT